MKEFIERTLVIIKPDGVKRNLSGEIISRFEKTGLKIVGLKMIWIDKDFAKKHYPESLIPVLTEKTFLDYDSMNVKVNEPREKVGKGAYEDLIRYISEGPVIAMVLEGVHAVEIVRKLVGTTSPHKSPPGTIRGDFTHLSMGYATYRKIGGRNLIHASGTKEEAKKEISLWFKESELHSYKGVHDEHIL
ncbi:MAG: nucleoside-diphosphate kinase [Nanoarchaeota archaeon]